MSVASTDTPGTPPPWPSGAAWIGGRYCPIEDAKISVLDLGVTRSDCTYDVVHVWEGRFYRLDAHLDRFAASMARLRLDPGYDRAGIEAIVHGCVRHAGLRAAYVSMTCTRGRMLPGSRDLRTAQSVFYCYAARAVTAVTGDARARRREPRGLSGYRPAGPGCTKVSPEPRSSPLNGGMPWPCGRLPGAPGVCDARWAGVSPGTAVAREAPARRQALARRQDREPERGVSGA